MDRMIVAAWVSFVTCFQAVVGAGVGGRRRLAGGPTARRRQVCQSRGSLTQGWQSDHDLASQRTRVNFVLLLRGPQGQ
jgi:hypothetical protein